MAERFDRLPFTTQHLAIAVLCALGLAFDIAEMAMGSALSAVFAAGQDATYLGLVLAAPYIGAVLGAPLFGRAADVSGRRNILAWVLLLQGATSVAAGLTTDLLTLAVLRCACGIALGAYVPIAVAYLTDILPAAQRGRVTLIVAAVGLIGGPAAVFLVQGATEARPLGFEGFQWGFVVFGVASACVGVMFPLVLESPRWMASAGNIAAAERIVARFEASAALLRQPSSAAVSTATATIRVRAPVALLTGLFFLSPWATVVFPVLGGAVLTQKGFAVSEALLLVGVAMIGPIVGTLLGAAIFDRFVRRTSLAVCTVGMLAASTAFALAFDPATLILSGVAFGVFSGIFVPALNMYASELFQTSRRALGTSSLWAVNRVASAIAPLVLTPLLLADGSPPMFAGIALALLISLVLLLLAPPGRAGRPVD